MVRLLGVVAAFLALHLPTQAFAQAQRWSVSLSGIAPATSPPYRRFAAADGSGNLFVAGRRASGSSGCFTVVKLTAAGATAWTREICGERDTGAVAIAVDSAGDAIATGSVAVCCGTNAFPSRADFRTVKLRGSDGAVVWDRSFRAGDPSLNVAYAVALDASGNAYVVGTSFAGERFRLKVIKYRGANGDVLWEALHDGEGDYDVIGAGLTPSGDLVIGSNVKNSLGFRPEIFGFVGSSGLNHWRFRGNSEDRLNAFAVDAFGEAVAVHYHVHPTTGARDLRIRKFGAFGTEQWLRDFGTSGEDTPWGVATDAAGNIVVAANADNVYDSYRFTRSGQMLSESTRGLERPAQASAVAYDAAGDIFTTGYVTTPQGRQMRVEKQDGILATTRWEARVAADEGIAVVPAGASVAAIGLAGGTLRVTSFANSADEAGPNVHGLWWNPSEPGWGVNIVQQGEKIFATWFAYAADGQGMWLVMSSGVRSGSNAWSGEVHRTTGPALSTFSSANAAQVAYELVGSATFAFANASSATVTTNIDGSSKSRDLTRYQFGSMPTCTLGGSAGSTPNYTDIWWRASEPGWGVSLSHQGDTIFALWYTYAPNSRGMWLVGSRLERIGDHLYSGQLHKTTGSPFNASYYADPSYSLAGTVTLNFTDANNALMDYTLNGGTTQTKAISRYVFASPVSVCR